MALFKIEKGLATNLLANRPNAVEGYCYFTTDDGKFYIDTKTGSLTGSNPTGTRVALNANYASKLLFGEITQSSSSTLKVSTVNNLSSLVHGTIVVLKNNGSNTAANANLNINNLGELNDFIINNNAGEIIQLSEIMQDYKLLTIAEQIVLNKETYKIVLLSGPSSSGKTTTSMKLSLYLKSLGLNPTHLSIDDYFHERSETPLGANGKPDFESLTAVDTKLFDNQISKLLKGSKVTVPTFNFVEGKKEYKRTIQLKDNDILIIEGLHALNENILTNIPKKKKFKVYISPLTYLNIDNDNRISMTDLRLLRRIVRDNRTRGYSPSTTLNNWSDVRDGEEKYVFPYQDNADVIFNSSLAYELAVLKTFAEPLLFTIKEDDPEYLTAQRLLELLKCVLPIPSETVPQISILREFIGGSYFE